MAAGYKRSIACIALCGGKVLIARRLPKGQMGGRWEFPGGKVEPGETDGQAIVREMREEFGMDVTPGQKICSATFMHDGSQVLLDCYRIFVPHDGMATPYTLSEHSEYRWADVSEVATLNFVDSDLKLYDAVCRYVAECGTAGKKGAD